MPLSNPRILLVNDDGINAPGLKLLERIAKTLSKDVWVVAPEQEQSGAAHSLSLHMPVRIRKITKKKFAISGTPTDCALLAKKVILPSKKPIDLLLSGVNRGSNVGDDITYSGTVAGAIEGALLGIPSIALSQLFTDDSKVHWDTALTHAPSLISRALEAGWPKDTLLNLNFPDCAANEVQGIRLCPQGKRIMSINVHPRTDPKNRPYFWLGGWRENKAEADTDITLLDERYITLTPLKIDMTDYPTLGRLQEAFTL